MHHSNNVVIMQTEQLGHIKALKEELRSSKVKMVELEQKMMEQDRVIMQLVGDNLDHLQDNMCLITHINSLQEQMGQLEHQLGQVRSVLMGMIKGAIEREGTMETSDSLEARTSGASGNDQDNQGGDVVNRDVGVFREGSMRRDNPMLWESGLIAQMEEEAMEVGLGGWFNGNPEDVPESWSGANSNASASQDQVGTTVEQAVVYSTSTTGQTTSPLKVRVDSPVVEVEYTTACSTKALGSDIEYPLRSNALSAKSVLGGRVALTHSSCTNSPVKRDRPQPEA